MADAAHALLVRSSSSCTGNFFSDEELLRSEGQTDFRQYQVDPDAELLADLFTGPIGEMAPIRMQPRIVEKPPLCVIGCEAAFIHALAPNATNAEVIGPLWSRFCKRIDQVPNRIGSEMFGIIYKSPEGERAHPDELQYLASVPVSSTADIPDGMCARTIPASTFAVFTHRGPIQSIADTVQFEPHRSSACRQSRQSKASPLALQPRRPGYPQAFA